MTPIATLFVLAALLAAACASTTEPLFYFSSGWPGSQCSGNPAGCPPAYDTSTFGVLNSAGFRGEVLFDSHSATCPPSTTHALCLWVDIDSFSLASAPPAPFTYYCVNEVTSEAQAAQMAGVIAPNGACSPNANRAVFWAAVGPDSAHLNWYVWQVCAGKCPGADPPSSCAQGGILQHRLPMWCAQNRV